MSMDSIILTVTPDRLREIQSLPVTPAHMAYRLGKGPHLFRTGGPSAPRGGLMMMDSRQFDGLGSPAPFCQEVVRECAARGFSGILCDFEAGRLPPLEQIIHQLGENCARRGWQLYVPEQYGHCADHARVLISSALSGGSLHQRLTEAQERFGADRVALAVQRVAEDFYLPSPTGSGSPLTREQLRQRLEELHPSVFFSHELCARYFTYMSRESGAHFVLFDDGATLAKKLEVARGLGVPAAVLAWPEVCDVYGELGLRPSPGREAGRH